MDPGLAGVGGTDLNSRDSPEEKAESRLGLQVSLLSEFTMCTSAPAPSRLSFFWGKLLLGVYWGSKCLLND